MKQMKNYYTKSKHTIHTHAHSIEIHEHLDSGEEIPAFTRTHQKLHTERVQSVSSLDFNDSVSIGFSFCLHKFYFHRSNSTVYTNEIDWNAIVYWNGTKEGTKQAVCKMNINRNTFYCNINSWITIFWQKYKQIKIKHKIYGPSSSRYSIVLANRNSSIWEILNN